MITVVSGLPRSGTSLMMQILEASGYEILTDGLRKADENNLNGYFEYEKVKSLGKDNSWMAGAEGKTVKIIAQLLPYIPEGFEYRIFFMERNLDEIVSSQSRMLGRLNKKISLVDNNMLKSVFEKQADAVIKQMAERTNASLLRVSFNGLMNNNETEIEALERFSEGKISRGAVTRIINPDHYREKF
ncbi:MAG: sulfotransferase family protein [Bacteroidota bacterium]